MMAKKTSATGRQGGGRRWEEVSKLTKNFKSTFFPLKKK